jgi:hypothetical protein
MNKRFIAKTAVKIIVGTVVASIVTKTLGVNIPITQKLKIAEMTGALAGGLVASHLEPRTDKIVDDFFDGRERAMKLNRK